MNSINAINKLLVSIKTNYINNNKYASCFYNKLSLQVIYVLYKKGLINNYFINGKKILISLKYYDNKPLIKDVQLCTKPSLKKYFKTRELKEFYLKNNYFLASTSQGLLFSTDAVKLKLGGKLLFLIKLNN